MWVLNKYIIPSVLGLIGITLMLITTYSLPFSIRWLPCVTFTVFAMATVILLSIWEVDRDKKELARKKKEFESMKKSVEEINKKFRERMQ